MSACFQCSDFPTRVRYLFHKQPFAGYDWPPEEGIVDRDLDMAISQFAPGAETVKDGLIHTSVGVVNYRPQGNRVVKQPNPLGPPRPDRVLPELSGGGRAAGTAAGVSCLRSDIPAAPGYEVIQLSQPLGFRTWFGRDRDFDGIFEWTPRASRPKMGATLQPLTPRANFGIWSGQETIFVVNDNGGQMFRLRQAEPGRNMGYARSPRRRSDVNNPR